MRGPRMPNTTVSTVAGRPCAVPKSFDCIRRELARADRVAPDRECADHERREQRDRARDREPGPSHRQPRRGSAVCTSASGCSGVGVW